MKSRYSAYSFGVLKYIIKTTHKENSDYKENLQLWGDEIEDFCKNTDFIKLEIIDFVDGEEVAFVTFKANLSSHGEDISFIEKSKFYKVLNSWLYHSGEFL